MSRTKFRRDPPAALDDPVELARAGAQLQARLDRLRATIDRMRRRGWTFTPRAPEEP